jgi:hypothetical protein
MAVFEDALLTGQHALDPAEVGFLFRKILLRGALIQAGKAADLGAIEEGVRAVFLILLS